MQVVSIISTKGGVGKTTIAANLGGLVSDAGLRVLLLDLDVQPTLSSYYELAHRAPGGIYELLAFNERDLGRLVSRTIIAGLDLVVSNDHRGELNTLLLHAPDGRLRLRHLLPVLAPLYDLLLIDTQGARSVLFLRDLPHPIMEGQIRDSSLTSDLIDDRVVQSPSDGFGTHCPKQSVHQVGCFVGRQIEGQFDVHCGTPLVDTFIMAQLVVEVK